MNRPQGSLLGALLGALSQKTQVRFGAVLGALLGCAHIPHTPYTLARCLSGACSVSPRSIPGGINQCPPAPARARLKPVSHVFPPLLQTEMDRRSARRLINAVRSRRELRRPFCAVGFAVIFPSVPNINFQPLLRAAFPFPRLARPKCAVVPRLGLPLARQLPARAVSPSSMRLDAPTACRSGLKPPAWPRGTAANRSTPSIHPSSIEQEFTCYECY